MDHIRSELGDTAEVNATDVATAKRTESASAETAIALMEDKAAMLGP